jgi:hypothetical protein
MKRKLSMMLLLSFVIGALLQAQPVKKSEKIKEEEVPVAVRIAFANDFGKIPEDGTWTVNFIVSIEGAKTVAKPTWYTYRKGNGQDKIEVRYSPDGKLDLFKGLKKADNI